MPEAEGPTNPKTAYEPKDSPPSLLAGLMALVAGVTIAVGLILSGIYPGTLNERSEAPSRLLPPKPRLQVNEAETMHHFDVRIENRLKSYGWIDRRHGIVHIPIKEAMQRAAAAGFPDWPGNPKAATKGAAQNGTPNQPKRPQAAMKGATRNGSVKPPKAEMKYTIQKPPSEPPGKPASKATHGAGAAPAGTHGR
jgi:hypothetical protein